MGAGVRPTERAMQLIDADTVHHLLDYPGLMDALHDAHRRRMPIVDRCLLQAENSESHGGEGFLVLPAWVPGRAMGVKMATIMPHNPERGTGMPTIHAMYQLFEADGEILVNEIAPRPHNSGHYTIEGAYVSQFEQHVRAVMGLPLGSTELRTPAVAMINLLGTDERDAQVDSALNALAASDGHLHVYGKLDSRVGRKMSHYTMLGDDMDATYANAREVTKEIRI